MVEKYIVVIMGPSGSGKSFIANEVLQRLSKSFQVVTKYISREPRIDELDENNNLKNGDIIPDTPQDYIEKLHYHYSTTRGDKKYHYGFSKEKIDDLLVKGKIPVINYCDMETFCLLNCEYPNKVLTLVVDPCSFDVESKKSIMRAQGRTTQEIEERSDNINNNIGWDVSDYTPNYMVIFNPMGCTLDETSKKASFLFLASQLISVFKAIGDRSHWINVENNLFHSREIDSDVNALFHKMSEYISEMPTIVRNRTWKVDKGELSAEALPSEDLKNWLQWVEKETSRQMLMDRLFDPETWNSYMDILKTGFPKVKTPEQGHEEIS